MPQGMTCRVRGCEDTVKDILIFVPLHTPLRQLHSSISAQATFIRVGEIHGQTISFGPPTPPYCTNSWIVVAQPRSLAFSFPLSPSEVPLKAHSLPRLGRRFLQHLFRPLK